MLAVQLLDAAAELVRQPRPASVETLARLLGEVLPDTELLGFLTRDCPHSPLKVNGPAAPTTAELMRLSETLTPGVPWIGTAHVAGEEREVLAVSTKSDEAFHSVYVMTAPAHKPSPDVLDAVAGLCDVLAARYGDRAAEADPGEMSSTRVAAQERARTLAELGDAHEAALTGVLAALRSRGLGDAAARQAATDVAVNALLELRQASVRERALSELTAAAAFDALAADLRALARHTDVRLDLGDPESDSALPAELAYAARAICRGVAMVLLEQPGVTRLRVAWRAAPQHLTVQIRDDGPGEPVDLDSHRITERVTATGGALEVDAVPGWGTTVAVTIPLAPVEAPEPGPLDALNTREREVLTQLATGGRNRDIAQALQITDHTVKFHVANILKKLGVRTRGEAAALAR